MDLWCASLLLFLIGQARGTTFFLYRRKNEQEIMCCEHKHWQIDTDYDHKVDCNATMNVNVGSDSKDSSEESRGSDQGKCEDIEKSIKSRDRIERDSKNARQLKSCLTVKKPQNINGFFACVDTFQLQNIYPFKSAKQNDIYILAFAKPKVVSSTKTSEKSHLNMHEGEPIILTCDFVISKGFSDALYVVYWIKTGGKGSTCIYSYEFDMHTGITYNFHCSFEDNLIGRVLNHTSDNYNTNTHIHNLTINKSTQSDSGHYVCALNVIRQQKGYWAVISNISVTVNEKGNQNTTHLSNGFPKLGPGTPLCMLVFVPSAIAILELYQAGFFILLYLVVTIVIIGIIVIAIYMKQKTLAKVSQFAGKQRHQNGDEAINPDISPYAVAGREFEAYSVVKLTEKPANHVVMGDKAKPLNEPYSIVTVTPQCNALGRPPSEDGDLKHTVNPGDTGTHVYESVDDPYSKCK